MYVCMSHQPSLYVCPYRMVTSIVIIATVTQTANEGTPMSLQNNHCESFYNSGYWILTFFLLAYLLTYLHTYFLTIYLRGV